MTGQGDLFEAHARRTDPETSKQSAAAVNVTELQQRVIDVMALLGGDATIKEVAAKSGLAEVSVSPRFKPLRAMGMIRDSGRRRKNVGGRSAIVWELVP